MNNNLLIDLRKYLGKWTEIFPSLTSQEPWAIPPRLNEMLTSRITELNRDEYIFRDTVAIHASARVEENVIIKGPAIISAHCFIAAHAYLRGGVFLGERVTIGPGCEVKSSAIMPGSALAHFNFVGDSLLGSSVNMEAGAVIANHYNERKEKSIAVLIDGKCIVIETQKFGALVGDFTKIGANAVLSPGTVLQPSSIVKRLALVEQCNEASA
jgi:NDP-sugar pyrophosphorylase family protein